MSENGMARFSRERRGTGGHPTDPDQLAELHFTMQHVEPAELDPVEVSALDPFLRGLLFTDGTVTRALEVQTLSRVGVEVVDQSRVAPHVRAARYLEAGPAEECLRRRVTMRAAGPPLPVWAESYILPERLPRGFVGALDGAAQGIGESMQGLRLESRRELLWFGLGRAPGWAPNATSSTTALVRVYRIITDDRPALLITETFGVEERSGLYGLLEPADGRVEQAHEALLEPVSRT
jgi:chorismate-pyruvate lyase